MVEGGGAARLGRAAVTSPNGRENPLPDQNTIFAQQQTIRRQAQDRRLAVEDVDGFSRLITDKLVALPEYQAARTVLLYAARSFEVQTLPLFDRAWRQKKRVAVPYCVERSLELFHLQSVDELVPATLGIPEPRAELRGIPERSVSPQEIDLFVVPGVAFDANGGRVGHGMGYFDRLLKQAKPNACFVGVAFQCQVVPSVPMTPDDVFMHKVITERNTFLEKT